MNPAVGAAYTGSKSMFYERGSCDSRRLDIYSDIPWSEHGPATMKSSMPLIRIEKSLGEIRSGVSALYGLS